MSQVLCNKTYNTFNIFPLIFFFFFWVVRVAGLDHFFSIICFVPIHFYFLFMLSITQNIYPYIISVLHGKNYLIGPLYLVTSLNAWSHML